MINAEQERQAGRSINPVPKRCKRSPSGFSELCCGLGGGQAIALRDFGVQAEESRQMKGWCPGQFLWDCLAEMAGTFAAQLQSEEPGEEGFSGPVGADPFEEEYGQLSSTR